MVETGGHHLYLLGNILRREFAAGYQYLMGSTAKLVSTESTDDQISKQWQGSNEMVYFVIPTPSL